MFYSLRKGEYAQVFAVFADDANLRSTYLMIYASIQGNSGDLEYSRETWPCIRT